MTDTASKAPAVVRAFAILDALAGSPRALGIADLSRLLDLPKSTTHGLIHTLVAEGAIRPDNGGYRLDSRVLPWATGFSQQNERVGRFLQLVESEAALEGETAMLSVVDGVDVLYVATRPGSKPLSVNFKPGVRIALQCTASGKAMLALLDEADCAARVAALRYEALTPHSLSGPDDVARELDRVRAQGYATDDEETAQGLLCLGAAVRDARGQPVAGVAVSVVKSTVDAARRRALQDGIVNLARRLSLG